MNVQQLEQQAFYSLQTGNNSQAITLFNQLTKSGNVKFPHLLGLSLAYANTADFSSALDAISRALAIEANNLRAVLLKADLLKELGRKKECRDFYQFALKLAANTPTIAKDLHQGLNRADEYCKQTDSEQSNYLYDKLKQNGLDELPSRSRFKQSLQLMFEDKAIFYQSPTRYYYPALPQIQFYEREMFEWVKAVEAATEDIKAELLAVLSDTSRFNPYVNSKDDILGQNNQGLADNNDWSALFLWKDGELVEENKALFPKTLKALEAAPLPKHDGVAPMALFSKLSANTKIPPHHGALNTRLICHLPLIVPENCGALRVGNEQREWVEGELLIFDDSIEHEAWNNSNEERVVLLFEIWRPEITDLREQALIMTMLEESKAHG